jgi:hypothetical protein
MYFVLIALHSFYPWQHMVSVCVSPTYRKILRNGVFMMKDMYATINSWDFCLFLVGVFHAPVFTFVKTLIETCDTEVFNKLCWIGVFIVISTIKRK